MIYTVLYRSCTQVKQSRNMKVVQIGNAYQGQLLLMSTGLYKDMLFGHIGQESPLNVRLI